ncbi:hypothetical protein IH785_00525 [candidate division KSB1 bacterium]|nr:hypothetical protein [candidate division KSB1 bacterium]
MEKSQLVFGSLINNDAFKKSIMLLSSLSEGKLLSIQKTYLESKYRTYYHDHLDKFSKKIDLSLPETHTLIHAIDFLAYHIVQDYSVQDIISAISELISENAEQLNSFLKNFKKKTTQEILENLDLIDDEIGTINPHFDDIRYNIQSRAIIKNRKVIDEIPVIQLQIDTSEKNESIVIEFIEDDLDKLITKLNGIKQELIFLKNYRNSLLKKDTINGNVIDN